MSTLTHQAAHASADAYRQPAGGASGNVIRTLRSSRALASMLPALLSSGVLTLVITAVMHLMWDGLVTGFAGLWMESWLTAWPIAFPVAYVIAPVLSRVAAYADAPEAPIRPGLGCGDIVDASARVTASHGLSVLRNLKPAHDFSAV
ncbi:MAG TPA: DUF2798 domain-containing protein [Noviherbaspirillum sp.]